MNQLTNLDGNGSYQTIEFSANKRQTGRWSLAAAFSKRWNKDHATAYFGQNLRVAAVGVTPANPERHHQHRRRPVRVQHVDGQGQRQLRGAVVDPHHSGAALPVGPALRPNHPGGAGNGVYCADGTRGPGINYGTQRILVEPIGTRKQDDILIFDIRTEKYFNLPNSRRIGVFFDVYNLTNSDAQQNITWNSGYGVRAAQLDRAADHRAVRHEVRLVGGRLNRASGRASSSSPFRVTRARWDVSAGPCVVTAYRAPDADAASPTCPARCYAPLRRHASAAQPPVPSR